MSETPYERTLRDIYPIFCDVCKQKIRTDEYFVTGLYLDDNGIPICRYNHRACLSQAPYAKTTLARPMDTGEAHCLYCGAETTDPDFTCDACRLRIKGDLRESEATEAVKELLRRLAEASTSRFHHTAAAVEPADYPPAEPRERPNPARTLLDMGATDPELTPFVPTNESGLIFMLGGMLTDLHYRMVAMPNQYPDAVLYSPTGKLINVEFEYQSGNFIMHKHDPALCDLVICWRKNRELPVPVLALEQHYNAQTGRWNFRDAATTALQ